ncbi:hypothetical protein Pint_30393 [Pistacia integerrima]|uniref:Uncharacterized protein n=1 Tax=Pistacia integerrima TaxID=434235 RepID=A0ACC0WZS7_9ROSI|nr:hypothetical protein Pint_30393 [Pistacia integerrima]
MKKRKKKNVYKNCHINEMRRYVFQNPRLTVVILLLDGTPQFYFLYTPFEDQKIMSRADYENFIGDVETATTVVLDQTGSMNKLRQGRMRSYALKKQLLHQLLRFSMGQHEQIEAWKDEVLMGRGVMAFRIQGYMWLFCFRNAQPSEKMKDAYAKDQKIMMYATSPLSSYIDLHICLLFSKFQVLMTSLGAGS